MESEACTGIGRVNRTEGVGSVVVALADRTGRGILPAMMLPLLGQPITKEGAMADEIRQNELAALRAE